jgi:RNA binding exosome subunit
LRRASVIILLLSMLLASSAYAGLLDKVREYRDKERQSRNEPDTDTIVSGLKEALSIGARNGVKTVSQVDGYYGNPLIRIPMPEKIQRIEKALRKAGFNEEVDKFILSMNRAAEKAAPEALTLFVDAVKEMTIPDALKILRGNDTAATDYLKSKTFDELYRSFKPSISSSMNDVGVTRTFKEMMDKTRRIPFLKKESVDLDHYVTSKALDGLFTVVGQEEKKIRKDPAARVTELLKTVFK